MRATFAFNYAVQVDDAGTESNYGVHSHTGRETHENTYFDLLEPDHFMYQSVAPPKRETNSLIGGLDNWRR